MTSRRKPRLADAAEIAVEQGLTPTRITQLYTERTENAVGETFPEPVDKRGRARLWDHKEVTEWFAHRAPTRLAEHAPPSRDPEELLNAADASRYLGYKNPNQVITFVRDHPGYFPEPDAVEEKGTDANPYRRQLWKVQTLQEWMASRPGRGRRAGAKKAPPLPEVPVDGDPDELLGGEPGGRPAGVQERRLLLQQPVPGQPSAAEDHGRGRRSGAPEGAPAVDAPTHPGTGRPAVQEVPERDHVHHRPADA
jgi:predicted DNA-binding transcriptional regulator AlpA